MSQTNTPSGADVLPTRRFAMKAAPCGVSMEEVDPDARGFVYYLCSDIDPAVAALIARNAELEAENKARMSADDVLSAIEDSAICLGNWGELHEARDLRRAAYTLIAERDALAAENKSLRQALESARQTSKFENHPFRPWHKEADIALARTPAKENDDG